MRKAKVVKKTRTMLNDTLLIKREVIDASKSAGDIEIPDFIQQSSNRGEVVAVGTNETEIHLGDIVVFSKVSEEEIEVDGEKLIRVHRKGVYWIEK